MTANQVIRFLCHATHDSEAKAPLLSTSSLLAAFGNAKTVTVEKLGDIHLCSFATVLSLGEER